ncbi:MAG: hypothetical protein ABI811_08810 [Acidobacteriota bacterium]
MKLALAWTLLFVSKVAVGQPSEWAGLVQEVKGSWNIIGSNGQVTGAVKPFFPIPTGSRFKLAGTGAARGRLKIALNNGEVFDICCQEGCPAVRNNCGEIIGLPPTATRPTFIQAVLKLLLSEPERYSRPAIGGRGTDDFVILLHDRILTAGLPLAVTEFVSATGTPKSGIPMQWIETRPIDDSGNLGDPLGEPALLRWSGTTPIGSLDLTPGLFQLSLLEGPVGDRKPTFNNAWILAAPAEQRSDLSDKYSAALEALLPKEEVIGLLLRAYLNTLAAGSRAAQ